MRAIERGHSRHSAAASWRSSRSRISRAYCAWRIDLAVSERTPTVTTLDD
jgi:hypothetical protein